VKVGAVDIGTNTMRLLVAEVDRDRIVWLDRRTTVTALGRGVDATGRLAADAMARTIDVLAGYGAAMDDARVEKRRAVATSATRDAANREEFLDGARAALGVRPDVIGGEEEASLAFAGATRQLPGEPPFVVIDIGGGSTEFVYGEDQPSYRVSLDVGTVRLSDRILTDRPATPDQMARAADHVAELFESVVLPSTPGTVVGVAGTFTSLSAISQDLPAYDPGRVHGSILTAVRLAELGLYLSLLTVAETAAIPSMDPARAPVILAGAVIAEQAVRVCGVPQVMVSEHDVLDGLALAIAR
jgi:exopolyphosphatase/guanosine-5'-triphosphate,3'-diphosphate pyrophosphatase